MKVVHPSRAGTRLNDRAEEHSAPCNAAVLHEGKPRPTTHGMVNRWQPLRMMEQVTLFGARPEALISQ